MQALMLLGEKAYIEYLKAISGEEMSAIPRELRLSYEEERAIVRTLHRQKEEQTNDQRQIEWPTLLTLRYELLCRGKEQCHRHDWRKKRCEGAPFAIDNLFLPLVVSDLF